MIKPHGDSRLMPNHRLPKHEKSMQMMRGKENKVMMKKFAFIILILAVTINGYSATEAVNGLTWTYNVSNGKASVGGGSYTKPAIPASTTGDVVVPSKLGGYQVTRIECEAFRNCSGLTSVSIPDSVTSIGSDAFYGCSRLTSVTIPDSVTSIGSYAFYGCSRLTSVTIPDGVTSIEDSVFKGCSGLTSMIIPDSVTSIGVRAFYDCSGLTSVTIPNSVTDIGSGAFQYCSGLTSLTIPDSVTSIGSSAFQYCSGLTSLTIPGSVASIGSGAFQYCRGLTCVTISNGVTSIGNYAFKGCGGLTSVSMPDSMTNIGYSAFYGCSGLTSVAIPDSVTSVGSDAFYGCSDSLFNTTAIPGVILVDGWVVDYTDSLSGTLQLRGCRGIGETAFYCCNGLTNIIIPDGVTSIGVRAFSYCSELTTVTIPDSVTSIGGSVFSGCSRLVSISVDINNLAYKSLNGLLLSKDGRTLIAGVNGVVEIPDGVTNIGPEAFFGCSGLTSVTIPDSVTSIGDAAFDGCSGLTNVIIPNSMTSIGCSAFYDCYGLTSMTIPNSVTSIGSTAFYGCSGLKSVVISDSVTSIEDSAFMGCGGLASVTIPDGVTSIGHRAFHSCTGLTSVTIPDGVTSIGDYAFAHCYELTSVTISDSVKSVGDSAFERCPILTNVYFEGNAPSSFGSFVFSSVSSDCTAYVTKESTGWGVNIPGTWRGIIIDYSVEVPIPELPSTATVEDIATALDGSADTKLAANITSATEYAAYRSWAMGLSNATAEDVKNSPNAWLSFALDTQKLIVDAPVDGDVTIDTFKNATTDGAFEFTVNIRNVSVGDSALEANIKKVFNIEGVGDLTAGTFSADAVEVSIATAEGGKVKFTVTPKNAENGVTESSQPSRYFFRARMK